MEKEIKKEVLCECKCENHVKVEENIYPFDFYVVFAFLSTFLLLICLAFLKDFCCRDSGFLSDFIFSIKRKELLDSITYGAILLLYFSLLLLFTSTTLFSVVNILKL